MTKHSRLAYYRNTLGFDRSAVIPFTKGLRIGCSQCEALCINGVATHETGCPHQACYCQECGNPVTDGQTCCVE